MELIAVVSAVACAVVVTPVAMQVARTTGIVDRPGPLKVQREDIPYLGGIGVFAGVVVGVASTHVVLLVPLALALGLGVIDDARDIPPVVRLVCEVIVGASVAAVIPVRGPALIGPVAVAVLVVFLINAVNLIDGLDGLASGVALMSVLGFDIVLDGDTRVIALAVAGALGGFLVFNRPPASVYLGDGGAYLIGATLAVLLALAWHDIPGPTRPVAVGALLFVAYPAAEAVFAVVRRMRARRSVFEGDRGHVYDLLVDRGWTTGRAALACVLAQAVLTVIGVAATYLEAAAAMAVVGAVAVAIIVIGVAGGFVSPSYPRS